MSELPVGQMLGPILGTGPAFHPPRNDGYRGEFVSLRQPRPAEDCPALFDDSHGDLDRERIWTYLSYGPFEDPAAMKEWLDGRLASSDPLFLTVVDNATDQPIGMASFLRMNSTMRVAELGHIWYVPTSHRTAANTEAIYLMLCEAFGRMGCRRVEWKCDDLNQASRRAALRLGFTYEGTFLQHMVIKGRNRDTAWFAMLDVEWPEIKPLFERALYADGDRVSLTELTRSRTNES